MPLPHSCSLCVFLPNCLSVCHSVEAEVKRFDVPMMGCELEGSTALCEGLYPGPGERLVAEACVMSTW